MMNYSLLQNGDKVDIEIYEKVFSYLAKYPPGHIFIHVTKYNLGILSLDKTNNKQRLNKKKMILITSVAVAFPEGNFQR